MTGNVRSRPLHLAYPTSRPTSWALPVYLNDDAYVDLMLAGNDYGGESSQGYLDAGDGLVLLGGAEGFRPLTADHSGFYLPGEGRGIVLANTPTGTRIVATQNSGPLLILERNNGPASRTGAPPFFGGYLSQSGRNGATPAQEASR